MTKTYAYGAKAPAEALAFTLLKSANRYYNALVEVENWRRALRDSVLVDSRAARDAAFAAATASESVGISAATQPVAKKPKLVISDAEQAQLDDIDAQANVLSKAAYHANDSLWNEGAWGTKNVVAEAVKRGVGDRMKSYGQDAFLHFRGFRGTGALGVQVQKTRPLTWAGLRACNDTRLQLSKLPDSSWKRHVLRFRCSTDAEGEPVWLTVPVYLHREPPPDTQIKLVKLIARKVGVHVEWAVHFTLEGEALGSVLEAPTKSRVAVDVGWRRFKEGLRVSCWVDSEGATGELRLENRLLGAWGKTTDLVSIRDKNHNAALASLLEARKANGDAWPEWLREATAHAHSWNKPQRLASLVWRWRKARTNDATLAPTDTLFAALEAWRKQDKHLYAWESHQRENVLAARKEAYRRFAKRLAAYEEIVLEDLDLRDFAELPEKDEPKDTPQKKNARPNRFQAALSELIMCIDDAASRSGSTVVRAKPAWSTQTCSYCEQPEEFDAARELVHTCSHCAVEWDQDFNAARNLLRASERLRAEAAPTARSPVKASESSGVSKVAQRRIAGKAKKKAAALEKV